MKRKFHNIDQNSDEWFSTRLGLITASNFGKIMANLGKPFGPPAIEYAAKVAIESVTNRRIETFQNEWMTRGIELEPEAREIYEKNTFETVKPGGFMQFGNYGGSADGLVNDDGLIEIKSVKFTTHLKRLEIGGIDNTYKWQIHGNIWIYDRQWCDFISYCPEFPESKQIYINRVEKDNDIIEQMETRLSEFTDLVNKYKKLIQ